MTDNEKELVKQTLLTPGWLIIERLLKNETLEARTAKYIDPEKDVIDLGHRAKALGYAAKMVDKVLKKINNLDSGIMSKPEIYR